MMLVAKENIWPFLADCSSLSLGLLQLMITDEHMMLVRVKLVSFTSLTAVYVSTEMCEVEKKVGSMPSLTL